MAVNKVRVVVKGSTGKSVKLPTAGGAAGAVIGVNLALPDGSIPTLQQLAAALRTGAATQDIPGNIGPPGGAQVVVWPNIQYVPPQVNYPARAVPDEDQGEDRQVTVIAGVPGPKGPQGQIVFMAGEPGEDGAPGPQGPPGPAGGGSGLTFGQACAISALRM